MSGDRRDLKDTMFSIMHSKRAGTDSVVLAASVIVADALFNSRMADLRMFDKFDEDQFFKLSEFASDLHERCEVAAMKFDADGDHESLRQVLIAVRTQLDGQPMATIEKSTMPRME